MAKRFRPLLPNPNLQSSLQSDGGGRADNDSDNPSRFNKKRIGNKNACVECRVRKTRCSGERPRCSNCQKRALATCTYMDTSPRDTSREMITILQTLPKNHAYHVLDRLRESGDITTDISTIIDDAASDREAGENYSKSHLYPSFEQELTNQFPIAYPSFPAISSTALRQSNLLGPANDAEQKSEKTMDDQQGFQPTQTGSRKVEREDASHTESATANKENTQQTPECNVVSLDYYDKQLRDLDISVWTNTNISSALAARVIGLYLRTDHPLLGVFDPLLFVHDLVKKQERYCSRFLVSAVLYLGCQMYSAVDEEAVRYVEQFWSDTRQLSDAEGQKATPLNMAALVLMSFSLMGQGRDDIVLKCAKSAVNMGMHLGLFATEGLQSIDLSKLSNDDLRLKSHAAWGAFCWSILIALFYRQPGVDIPASTPVPPIPRNRNFSKLGGVGGTSDVELDDEDDQMGGTFHSLCEFWSMIHDGFLFILSPSRETTLISASIWMHAALLDIVRPFKGSTPQDAVPWRLFMAPNSSAQSAYTASVNQLKRLVLDYRSNYKSSAYSLLWHTGLLYLINAILESPRDPEWHSIFLLCIYGYENLRRPYSISATIGKSLLSMTLRDTSMSGIEAKRILEQLEGGELPQLRDHLRATFMADLSLSKKDPGNASVESLAANFESLALFNDLLQQDNMDISSSM
ncbi:hypothetical protein S40288_08442 [Stachybotrys chartarum IBT 40288]|nr:hypothetical protein S40288_08442 [Stachybotrys chartarum IBT 40288]